MEDGRSGDWGCRDDDDERVKSSVIFMCNCTKVSDRYSVSHARKTSVCNMNLQLVKCTINRMFCYSFLSKVLWCWWFLSRCSAVQQMWFKAMSPSTSLMHVKVHQQPMSSYTLESIEDSVPLFDNSAVIDEKPHRAVIAGLVPQTFMRDDDAERNKLLDDMESLVSTMKDEFTRKDLDKVTCRLALLEGVRCPKWHNDYVKFRLIKTYCGEGTEFVDPSDVVVRFTNRIRAYFDKDFYVDPTRIQQARVGDVLVISGKLREQIPPKPSAVLHRSPLVSKNSRRLLFTVTVS